MKDPKHLKEIQMRADWLAHLMDDAFEIPIIKVRLGWDSILGFIPGVGDLVGLMSNGMLIRLAHQAGARKRVYVWIASYAMVDFVVGVVPGVGDVFDIFWKSNRRGAKLLRREIAHQTAKQIKT